jgi:hypothetical protein
MTILSMHSKSALLGICLLLGCPPGLNRKKLPFGGLKKRRMVSNKHGYMEFAIPLASRVLKSGALNTEHVEQKLARHAKTEMTSRDG